MHKQKHKQMNITPDEQATLNLFFAQIRCASELLHCLPEGRQLVKKHYKAMFDTVKKYEAEIDKACKDYPQGKEEQDFIYNELMEVQLNILANAKSEKTA